MFRALKPLPQKLDQPLQDPALGNPAVAHCWQTRERVYRAVYKEKDSGALARIYSAEAYRRAMPELRGRKNIQNFIACVTFGFNAGILFLPTVKQLLQAAQVADRIGFQSNKNAGKTSVKRISESQ